MSLPSESDAVRLDAGFGYVNRAEMSPRKFHPQLVLNSDNDSMLRALRHELKHSSSFTFSVAFVSASAIALLKQELVDFRGTGRIVTSTYLGFNSPQVFSELLNLTRLPKSSIDVRLHASDAFHPKGYVFQRPAGFTAILGSSNLTAAALARNHEWNLRVSGTRESDLFAQLSNVLDRELFESEPLTQEWIDRYAETYIAPVRLPRSAVPPLVVTTDHAGDRGLLEPNSMQLEALERIDVVRASGESKALVISATGTGKTILAALDVRAADPERMLFIVHREQILDRAITEFQRVLGLPRSEFGKLSGSSRETGRRFTFATVQSLSQPYVLESFAADAFDYILIDEVHRAGAASYARVLEHFKPRFLLGMTATPERGDGTDIFALFDYNVPYEIRLNRALEEGMLAPFHYYGITDVLFEDGTTADEGTALSKLVAPERVDYILSQIATYTQAGVAPRGLMFCSRKEEARSLSEELNRRELHGKMLRTVALTGEDSVALRERYVQQLESGGLDYILTVDIFNEGVDIPSINQVVMLRQTQSSIVFVQQLGRGLRIAPQKEYVVVIDFIGNYSNNYLIPIALFGDESLDKESLRKSLISAEESGVFAGLSSIRFDRIAQERVLRSIAQERLDSLPNLKSAVELIRNRVGRIPFLHDFLEFNSVDPVVLSTKEGNYPELLAKLRLAETGLTREQSLALSVVSREFLTAKRPHELVVLRALLRRGSLSREEMSAALAEEGLSSPEVILDSIARSLTLEFNTASERASFRSIGPARQWADHGLKLEEVYDTSYSGSNEFKANIDDLIGTGIELTSRRYLADSPFTPGKQYSRKDASRLLNWSSNMYSTIYGYKVDKPTMSCPIFVTLKKSDSISASTAYADELIDQRTMQWASKSNRTLSSPDVAPIVDGSVDLHVFMKQSDADASAFYYLGAATASGAHETEMQDDRGGAIPVVHMTLNFSHPIDAGLYDYFHTDLTRVNTGS